MATFFPLRGLGKAASKGAGLASVTFATKSPSRLIAKALILHKAWAMVKRLLTCTVPSSCRTCSSIFESRTSTYHPGQSLLSWHPGQ